MKLSVFDTPPDLPLIHFSLRITTINLWHSIRKHKTSPLNFFNMNRKLILVAALALFLAWSGYAQENHNHASFSVSDNNGHSSVSINDDNLNFKLSYTG